MECHFALRQAQMQRKPTSKRTKKNNRRGKARIDTSFRGRAGAEPFTYQPPTARRVRLTWNGTHALTESVAGQGAVNTYKLNSVYDVDDTFGSTSTPGFTEWAAFFANYRVWETSVRIAGSVSGAATGGIAVVTVFPNATNTFVAGLGMVAPMGVKLVRQADGVGGVHTFDIRKRFHIPTVLRITNAQYNNEADYAAATSANPAKIARFGVSVQGVNSASVVTAAYTIWVEMLIEFYTPYILAS